MDHIAAAEAAAAGRAVEPHPESATTRSSPERSVPRQSAGSSLAGPSERPTDALSPGLSRSSLAAARDTAGAVLGTVMGVLPHVLHHIGLLAGAALVTGTTGNVVFLVVGLLFSVPLLRRIHRRFRTWLAPTVAVGVFIALFSVSAFVVGPALSGTGEGSVTPSAPTAPTAPAGSAPASVPAGPAVDEHAGHHP